MTEPLTIAVLGTNAGACDIARSRALAGHLVRIYDPQPEAVAAAVAAIRTAVERDLAAGLVTAADRQRTFDAILATSDLDEAVGGAAVVIDAR